MKNLATVQAPLAVKGARTEFAATGSVVRAWPSWLNSDILIAAGLCAAAFFLRIRGIGTPSIWIDEAASWTQARADFIGMLQQTSRDNYPPLHNAVLFAVMHIFGDSETALRIPSAIFGALTVSALYWLGLLLNNRSAGIVAAILLGCSGFHIWFSQEARPYALMALCATVLVATLLTALRSGQTRWYAASTIASVALLYSHPFGTLLWVSLVLPVAVLAVMGRGGLYRKLILWQMLALVGFLPWAFVLFGRAATIAEKGFWIPPVTPHTLYIYVRELVNGNLMLGMMAPAVLAALLWPHNGSSKPFSGPDGLDGATRLFLFAWLIGPLLFALALTFTVQPLLIARYLLVSLPAAVLLAAIGMSHMMVSRGLRASLLIAATSLALFSMDSVGQQKREDWRGATTNLLKVIQSSDCIAIRNAERRAFSYYVRQTGFCLLDLGNPSEMNPANVKSPRMWLVLDQLNNPLSPTDLRETIERFTREGWRKSMLQDGDIAILSFESIKP